MTRRAGFAVWMLGGTAMGAAPGLFVDNVLLGIVIGTAAGTLGGMLFGGEDPRR